MSQRKSFYDETLDRLSFKLLNQNLPPGTNLDGSHFVESGNQCLENDVKMRIEMNSNEIQFQVKSNISELQNCGAQRSKSGNTDTTDKEKGKFLKLVQNEIVFNFQLQWPHTESKSF